MSDGVVLEARGLSVDRAGRRVLEAVDLQLHRGEVVAVVGPNGAGKSTLLATFAGLLDPSGGEVVRGGRVATALQAPGLLRRTARQNVEAALGWWGVPRGQRRARAEEALAALKADGLAARHAHTLSGGEARRVHLARALAVRADALLLDEPFAGLDAVARADLLYDAAAALRSGESATLVVVHDRAEAWALADRIVVLIGGRVHAEGVPQAVLERPPSEEVARFLGFVGHVDDGDERLLVRPAQVALDPGGPTPATVRRVVPLEDGMRLELTLDDGRGELVALAPLPGPRAGERVRVRITGGVRFPAPRRTPPR